VASGINLVEKAEFLRKVGSNLVLTDQNIKYFPRGAWKILGNLLDFGAEPRSDEATNVTENVNYSSMLTRWDYIGTCVELKKMTL